MKRKFVAFDIDGTFFRSHLFWEVALELARKDTLHPKINEEMLELYSAWKRRAHEKAFEEFDYKSILKIKELVTELDPKTYDKYMEKTLQPLLDYVYLYPKKLKEQLQERGYMAIAISGSRIEEVDLFAEYHKFDDWIGQKFHRTKSGDAYTGTIDATWDQKERLLKDFVKKHDLTYTDSFAIGDTSGDIGMLELVENPIAFNPNHSLLAHAKKNGWDIVIERKSINYHLKYQDGTYTLAETVE